MKLRIIAEIPINLPTAPGVILMTLTQEERPAISRIVEVSVKRSSNQMLMQSVLNKKLDNTKMETDE